MKNIKGEDLRLDFVNGEGAGEAVGKLSDGIPGVIMLLAEMVNGGAGSGLFILDMLGLYGAELWKIFEEDNGSDFNATMDDFARRAQEADAQGVQWQPVPEEAEQNDNSRN